MLNFFTIILLLSIICSLALAQIVYMRNPSESTNKIFAMFSLSMALWALIDYNIYSSLSPERALYWHNKHVLYYFSIMLLLHFILIFTEKNKLLKNKFSLITLYGLAATSSIIELIFVKIDKLHETPWGYLAIASKNSQTIDGIMDIWSSILGIVIIIISSIFFIKQKEKRKKKQAFLVASGMIIIVLLGVFTEIILPRIIETHVPPLTASSFTAASIIIAYAIWKYGLFSLDPEKVSENIISTMPDSLLLVNPDGIITRVNGSALILLNLLENEIIGYPYEKFLFEKSDDSQIIIFEKELIKNRLIHDKEIIIHAKNDKAIKVSLSASLIEDKRLHKPGIVIVLRDLTDRINEEKKLRILLTELEMKTSELEKSNMKLHETTQHLIQAEKLTAIGELTAGITHELNQPLNVIKIINQSLHRDIIKNRMDLDRAKSDFKEVDNQVNKMAEIVNHMMIFAHSSSHEHHEEIDIETTINNGVKFVKQQLQSHGIDLLIEIDKNLPETRGYGIQIEQVLLNLINNAKNSLQKSNNIDKYIKIKAEKINNDIVITVSDNGTGIPEKIQEKIFEPFFTTKEKGEGTGLGLAIIKRIINEHDGEIKLQSSPGEGTTFIIKLPIRK